MVDSHRQVVFTPRLAGRHGSRHDDRVAPHRDHGQPMTTFVLRNGVLVEKDKASPLPSASRPQRHISDNMEATWHPASGRFFSSKSRFRGHTKEMGCIEVGNSM